MPENVEKNPFVQEILNDIFKISPIYMDRLIARESSWLEFKQSFNWGNRDDYAKTLVAFANTKGGYIVFGIGNKPRLLIGLRSDNFENIDPAKVSEYLNENFSPEIKWQMHLYEVQGKLFGIIHVGEVHDKLVIARKNIGGVREGEIYYRYRGRTEKIKFPELRHIIDEQRRKERDYWMFNLKQIAKIGVKNTAILDIATGKVTGSGGSFIIDEKLLTKLRFIKEGEFHEVKGAPTLKLIGDLSVIDSGFIQPTKTVFRTKAIRTIEIIHAFLEQEKVSEPIEYIIQVCYESSAFLPIYYFMKLAGLTKDRALEIIKNVPSRSQNMHKLIERIQSNRKLDLPAPVEYGYISDIKRYRDQILKCSLDESINLAELKYVLRAIRTLKLSEVDLSYILPLLREWFDKYYANRIANLADDLRRTISHLDIIMNGIIYDEQ